MPAQFTFHDIETAPERSKPILKRILRETGSNGFYAVMAESPEALSGYNALSKAFSASSLTDEEKTVVWQTINVEHECNFCVPAHTAMAKRMMISEKVTTALRDETPLPTNKLEGLREFTLILVRKRGYASDTEIATFLNMGYTHQNILEIVLGIAQKVVSNYVNHLAQTPVEDQHKKYTWSKAVTTRPS